MLFIIVFVIQPTDVWSSPDASRALTLTMTHSSRTAFESVLLKKRSKNVVLPAPVGPTIKTVSPTSAVMAPTMRVLRLSSTVVLMLTIFPRTFAVIFSKEKSATRLSLVSTKQFIAISSSPCPSSVEKYFEKT